MSEKQNALEFEIRELEQDRKNYVEKLLVTKSEFVTSSTPSHIKKQIKAGDLSKLSPGRRKEFDYLTGWIQKIAKALVQKKGELIKLKQEKAGVTKGQIKKQERRAVKVADDFQQMEKLLSTLSPFIADIKRLANSYRRASSVVAVLHKLQDLKFEGQFLQAMGHSVGAMGRVPVLDSELVQACDLLFGERLDFKQMGISRWQTELIKLRQGQNKQKHQQESDDNLRLAKQAIRKGL